MPIRALSQEYQFPIDGNEYKISMQRVKDRIYWIQDETESETSMNELSYLAKACSQVQNNDAILIHTSYLAEYLRNKADEKDDPDSFAIDVGERFSLLDFVKWTSVVDYIRSTWLSVEINGSTYYYCA